MLYVLRALFIASVTYISYFLPLYFALDMPPYITAGAGFAISVLLVTIELFSSRFVAIFSVITVAVILGFVASKLMLSAFYLLPSVYKLRETNPASAQYLESLITIFITFLCVIMIIKTKDEFKFVLPYVEFRKQRTFGRPVILDTSAIIDGRIQNILETGIMDCEIVIPRFVLEELQKLADSHDKLKRAKGRRGFDIINKIKELKAVSVKIPEIMLPDIVGVDNKLVELSRSSGGRIMTNDFQLEKVAQIQGVDVINLNSLTKAVQLSVMQGDRFPIEIVRRGESAGQGVGFLPDGTMVVGEGCENRIGKSVDVVVKNIIQTTAGRIVFAEPAYDSRNHKQPSS